MIPIPSFSLEKFNRALSWKLVIAVNIAVVVVAVTVASINLVNTNTEYRSRAAEIVPTPTPYSPPNYPTEAPILTQVVPFYGKPGDTVVLLGKNFGKKPWRSSVAVGGAQVTSSDIVNWTDTRIDVIIPQTAKSGPVAVAINGKQTTWNGMLSISDGIHAAQVTIRSVSPTQDTVSITNILGATHGMIEISGLGVKTFQVNNNPMSIGTFTHPEGATLSILRFELFDAANQAIPVYSSP